MQHPYATGERVYLRRLERADLTERYLSWLNDEEVTRWMLTGAQPHSPETLEAFFEGMEASPSDLLFAIVLRDGDRHVGNLGVHRIHPVCRSAEIGILLGERDVWGQGLATEAISLIAEYGFRRLNLNRLYAGAVAENTGSIAAFEKAGFTREGVSREAYFCDGRYVDTVQLGLLRSEWAAREARR